MSRAILKNAAMPLLSLLSSLLIGALSLAAAIEPISVHPANREPAMEADVCVDGSCKQNSLQSPIDPNLPKEIIKVVVLPTTAISDGIKRTMNTLYQRCDAYDLKLSVDYSNPSLCDVQHPEGICAGGMKPGDMFAYENKGDFFSYEIASSVGGHPYTKAQYPVQCRDMKKTPPVFKVGGKSSSRMQGSQVVLNLFNSSSNNTGGKFITSDCSGFVSDAFLASGYKFFKQGPASQQVGTSALHDFRKDSANACIKPVSFTSKTTLRSGDILLFENGSDGRHSMVIDHVGEDPFGLNQIPADVSCKDGLSQDNFDINIVQSGLYDGRAAISKQRYQDAMYDVPGRMFHAMWNLAMKACEIRKAGGTQSTVSDTIAVLRHVGTNDSACYVHKPAKHPDCVDDPDGFACSQPFGAKIEGEECLATCSNGSAQ